MFRLARQSIAEEQASTRYSPPSTSQPSSFQIASSLAVTVASTRTALRRLQLYTAKPTQAARPAHRPARPYRVPEQNRLRGRHLAGVSHVNGKQAVAGVVGVAHVAPGASERFSHGLAGRGTVGGGAAPRAPAPATARAASAQRGGVSASGRSGRCLSGILPVRSGSYASASATF